MKSDAPAPLDLAFLGTPLAARGGKSISFPTRKALALLLYLVAAGGPRSRESLVALFWPDSDPDRARATLRSTLVLLRRAIDSPDGASHLIADRSTVAFDFRSPFTLDLQPVRAAYAISTQSAIGAVGSDVRAGVVERLHTAVELYRGPFADGLTLPEAPEFEDWLELEREAWRRRADAILARLTLVQLDTSLTLDALEYTGRWLALSPANEEAWRRLIQIHLVQRDRAAALSAYERCVDVLRDQLDAEPAPETQQLAERIARLAEDVEPAPRGRLVLPEGALVGRAAEMEVLVGAFDRVRRGETRLAIVEGEAGMGKTRLVATFERWVEAQGGDVLHGRTFEAGRRLPYAAPAEALRVRLEHERAPDDLLPDVWLAELSRLLPELRDRYPDLPDPDADQTAARSRLFEAIARVLVALAGRMPLVFAVDDTQWLDVDSMDALRYCLRRLADEGASLLLVLIVRSEALAEDTVVTGWLAQLRMEAPADWLRLDPVTLEDTTRWLESVAASEEHVSESAAQLYAETKGHPLFMTEMVKLRVDRGLWRLRSADGAGSVVEVAAEGESLAGVVPSTVRDAIVSRMSGIIPDARQLLMAGSVLGGETDFEDLRVVAGLPESEALGALESLLRARFLSERRDGRLLVAHDLVREVVYAEAGEVRRRMLHRRALETLQAAGAPSGTLAGHALGAGLWERGFELSLAAGEDAMRRLAVHEAIRHYERARELTDTHASIPAVPLPAYAALGRAYELAGDIERARGTYEELLAEAETAGEVRMQCVALGHLAGVIVDAAPLSSEALPLLGRALDLATGSGDRLALAETELRLAQTHYYAHRLADAKEHGERALALAGELQETGVMARSASLLGHIAVSDRRLEDAIARAEEAHGLAVSLNDGVLEADCLRLLAEVRLRLGEPRQSITLLREAAEITEQLGNILGTAAAEMWLALALVEIGEAREALEAARRAVAAARRHGSPPYVLFALIALGGAQRALQMLEDARSAHGEALDIAEEVGIPLLIGLAASELCADLVLAGTWEEAHVCERKALQNRDHTTSIFRGTIPLHCEIQALVHAGELEAAEEDLARFERQYAGLRRYAIPLLRGRAALSLARGRLEEARESLQEALTLAADMGLVSEIEQICAELVAHPPAPVG